MLKKRHVGIFAFHPIHNSCIELPNIYALIELHVPHGLLWVTGGSCWWGWAFLLCSGWAHIKKAQLIQPEAVKKCWQQAASRRTKCRPRCINKDIKNQMSLRKWTAEHGLLGDIEGEKIPLCKSVDEFPQEIFKNALFHRWMDSFCRYSHLNSELSCQNLHFQKARFKTR